MKSVLYTFICLALLSCTIPCQAQNHTTDHFIARENVVFSDDFSGDKIGVFPALWDEVFCLQGYDETHRYKRKVKREDHKNVLLMNTCITHIFTKQDLSKYLSDSFTVECDYFMENTFAELSVALMAGPHKKDSDKYFYCHKYSIYISQWGNVGTCIAEGKETEIGNALHHVCRNHNQLTLDTLAWHHLAISYKKRQIKVYIDSALAITVKDCGYVPTAILLGGAAMVKLRDMKIATGPITTPLKELLKGRPVVTHTILFATGTARLSAASERYLDELAQLLKDNPKLKLEIQGHTDNTGTDADNQLLSEKRAAAVKDALVKKGIADARLGTKGYGAARPLKAGSSEEIKAMNRRVEFVPG